MRSDGKATRINLFDVTTPPMRAFHLSWFAFFLCFFAWFGVAPLMIVVRKEMGLTPDQVGWCMIGSVAITIVARMAVGRICDRFGPRRTYAALLVFGSLPVMGIGLAHDFTTFLLFRVAIGVIGASFVITQYHTSFMFAPNCVGTANAAAAGWGNLGGGVTQIVMPLAFGLFATTFGLGDALGWRLAMLAAGAVCFLTGITYCFLTQDTPLGDFASERVVARLPASKAGQGGFREAARDSRVWALFVLYGACFGVELTMDNIAALYYADYFGLSLRSAGLAAGSVGLLHLFARALGGIISDRIGGRSGLKGRVNWLFAAVLIEGIGLMFFSRMTTAGPAITAMIGFGLFMKMAEGATYAVVPFVNKRALGSVAGIVGAGGNAGAVVAGFLFKGADSWPTALLILGALVVASSFCTLAVRFSTETEEEAARDFAEADAHRIKRAELAGALA